MGNLSYGVSEWGGGDDGWRIGQKAKKKKKSSQGWISTNESESRPSLYERGRLLSAFKPRCFGFSGPCMNQYAITYGGGGYRFGARFSNMSPCIGRLTYIHEYVYIDTDLHLSDADDIL